MEPGGGFIKRVRRRVERPKRRKRRRRRRGGCEEVRKGGEKVKRVDWFDACATMLTIEHFNPS